MGSGGQIGNSPCAKRNCSPPCHVEIAAGPTWLRRHDSARSTAQGGSRAIRAVLVISTRRAGNEPSSWHGLYPPRASLPATNAAPAPPYHLARRDARNATVPRSFCTRLQRHSMHWRCSCAWTAGVSGLALACYLQPRLALKGRPCASRSAAACSFARHGRPSSSVPSARGCAEGRTALPGRQGGARCQTRFGLGCTQNECFGLSATWGRRRGALLHVSGAMCGRARFSQRAPNARTLRPAPPLPRVSSPRADAARAEDERAQSIRDAISSAPALAGCARTGVAGGLAARNMLACLALAERMKDSRGASRPQNVAWVRGGTWWHGRQAEMKISSRSPLLRRRRLSSGVAVSPARNTCGNACDRSACMPACRRQDS